jgi:hypothetical protein
LSVETNELPTINPETILGSITWLHIPQKFTR